MVKLLRVTIFCLSFSFVFTQCMELNNSHYDPTENTASSLVQLKNDINLFEEQPTQASNTTVLERMPAANKKSITCPYCGEKFTFKTNRSRHIRKSHLQTALTGLISKKISCPEKNIICAYCDKKFSKEKDLQLHNSRVHMAYENRPHNCNACGMRFLRKSELEEHANKPHDKIVPFRCTLCLFMSLSKSALRAHTTNQHLQEMINNLS